jgi:hypothetical protein
MTGASNELYTGTNYELYTGTNYELYTGTNYEMYTGTNYELYRVREGNKDREGTLEQKFHHRLYDYVM